MIELIVLFAAPFLGLVFSKLMVEERDIWMVYLPKISAVFFGGGVALVFFDKVSAYSCFFLFLLSFFWWKSDVFLKGIH